MSLARAAVVAAVSVTAFMGGRLCFERPAMAPPGREATAASPVSPGAAAAAAGSASSATTPADPASLGNLGTALAVGATAATQPPASIPATEPPDYLAYEQKLWAERIDQRVPNLPAATRAKLLEAALSGQPQVYALERDFGEGRISGSDYMNEVRARMNDAIKEDRGLLTDDQYRAFTGLQPGADPYEALRTGQGVVPPGSPGGPPSPVPSASFDPAAAAAGNPTGTDSSESSGKTPENSGGSGK